jgi:signal transduction histidine kinase
MDLTTFFDTSGFPARWHCGSWSDGLGWLTICSDVAIFVAYIAIPLIIIAYVRQKRDVPFPQVFWLFCAFIFACGTTHLIDAVIFWWPIYPVAGLMKLVTALVSLATVGAVVVALPKASALPGLAAVNERLEREMVARVATEHDLRLRSAELQESEHRLVAAQRAAGIGDWAWDPSTRSMRWSAQMYVLFERDPAQGPPADPAAHSLLYPPKGEHLRQDALARIDRGQTGSNVDLEVHLPSGRSSWFRCIISADRASDGTLRRIWGTVQDITAEYHQVQALEVRHQDLLRINEHLEQFAYIASHDLLEPLRKVRFFADVVQAEMAAQPGSTADDAMQRMLRATDRMHRLINDLLAFARAGKSLGSRSPVEIATVVGEAMEAIESQIAGQGALIRTSDLPVVLGDRNLLVQVFQNLLSNSLRYRQPDRRPEIWIQGSIEDVEAVISVSDNGLGFDPDQAQRLFEPFVRLHPQAGHDGTGIGLAICRRIIAAHDGSIDAIALAEGGACFTIRLPLREGPNHAA